MKQENPVTLDKLFEFPWDAFLMLRLEFMTFCGQTEMEAKMLRIIEVYVEVEREHLFRELANKTPRGASIPKVPRDVWVSISYNLFRNKLFKSDISENTLKTALRSLEQKKLIEIRYNPKKRYDTPEYRLQIHVIDKLNDILRISGGQFLIPSKIEALKNLSPQFLMPTGCQFLIPSEEDLSSIEKSRVSKIDANIRDTNKKRREGGKIQQPQVSRREETPPPSSFPSTNTNTPNTPPNTNVRPLRPGHTPAAKALIARYEKITGPSGHKPWDWTAAEEAALKAPDLAQSDMQLLYDDLATKGKDDFGFEKIWNNWKNLKAIKGKLPSEPKTKRMTNEELNKTSVWAR